MAGTVVNQFLQAKRAILYLLNMLLTVLCFILIVSLASLSLLRPWHFLVVFLIVKIKICKQMVFRLFASIPSFDASYYDVKYTENDR